MDDWQQDEIDFQAERDLFEDYSDDDLEEEIFNTNNTWNHLQPCNTTIHLDYADIEIFAAARREIPIVVNRIHQKMPEHIKRGPKEKLTPSDFVRYWLDLTAFLSPFRTYVNERLATGVPSMGHSEILPFFKVNKIQDFVYFFYSI